MLSDLRAEGEVFCLSTTVRAPPIICGPLKTLLRMDTNLFPGLLNYLLGH